ncbi:MAG: hypothetical protein AAF663_00605 [Planctomycetota bacterium]
MSQDSGWGFSASEEILLSIAENDASLLREIVELEEDVLWGVAAHPVPYVCAIVTTPSSYVAVLVDGAVVQLDYDKDGRPSQWPVFLSGGSQIHDVVQSKMRKTEKVSGSSSDDEAGSEVE